LPPSLVESLCGAEPAGSGVQMMLFRPLESSKLAFCCSNVFCQWTVPLLEGECDLPPCRGHCPRASLPRSDRDATAAMQEARHKLGCGTYTVSWCCCTGMDTGAHILQRRCQSYACQGSARLTEVIPQCITHRSCRGPTRRICRVQSPLHMHVAGEATTGSSANWAALAIHWPNSFAGPIHLLAQFICWPNSFAGPIHLLAVARQSNFLIS
jgi:hypothetical protein